MNLLRRFPLGCVALVMLAIAGFCLVQGDALLLVAAGTLAAVSWYVTEGPRGRTIPRWLSNLLVLVATAAMVRDLVLHPGEVPGVLGRYATWLTVVKLYERRTARDHAQLLVLSLLLMLIGAAHHPPPLLFGAVLLVYALFGVRTLLLYQLYAAHERHVATRRREEIRLARPSLRPVFGRHPAGHLRLVATIVGILGIGLSIVVFVAFPRHVGRGAFSPFAGRTSTLQVTGYSEEVDLIASARITPSPRPIATLRLRDEAGGPLVVEGPLHLRGSALEAYRGGRWRSVALGEHGLREAEGGGPIRLADPALVEGRTIRQSLRFFRPTETLFHLYLPVSLEIEGTPKLRRSRRDASIRASGGRTTVRAYDIVSCPAPSDALARSAAGPWRPIAAGSFWDRATPAARRIRGFAIELLRESGVPEAPPADPTVRDDWKIAVAEVFSDHLAGGAYTYTLDLRDVAAGESDPVERFLFEARRGHCEYFASALVAMCHVVGVEARLVAGFIVSERDPDDPASWLIRASHAHAWVEVPDGRSRYRILDPTPAGSVGGSNPLGLAGRLGWIYEQVEGSWSDRFVGFDETAQADLFEALDQGSTRRIGETLAALRAWAERVNRAFRLGPAGYIWLGIVGLAVVIAIVALARFVARSRRVRTAMRLRRVRRASARRLVRTLGFYIDMLAVLRRAGLEKPEWRSPLAHADTIAESRPDAAELVRRIGSLYYAGRFGGRVLSDEEAAGGGRLVAELAAALERRR